MFCGLRESVQKLRKKRKKTSSQPKVGLRLGWKGILDIQPHEIFFAVLEPFLTETAFFAKLAGLFSGSKTKVRDLLPRNLVQT